jgi:integrase
MGCSVRTNRHGYLCFRLFWKGIESHEGTQLVDCPENRTKVEARARVIDDEIREGVFSYLRWFPTGNQAWRFRQEAEPEIKHLSTVKSFFERWHLAATKEEAESEAAGSKYAGVVSAKWVSNRASYIRNHILPYIGSKRLDELKTSDLIEIQGRLSRRGMRPGTIDGAIHSALRGMLRDARLRGFEVPILTDLYDRAYIRRLSSGSEPGEIDPYTEEERDRIIETFGTKRDAYLPFVFFQFWTGARTSEAVALRWSHVDLERRKAWIRGSRVLGREGRPKTGKSKRELLLHENLIEVLQRHMPLYPAHDDFVFTTPSGAPIDQANFYAREWVPMLRRLKIRQRPFYNTRHTYISYMLEIGAKPLWAARQTGTSLDMIEKHYGKAKIVADDLDALIDDAAERAASARALVTKTRNPPGTFDEPNLSSGMPQKKTPEIIGGSSRAGDRGRTGDVQLGKQTEHDPKTPV